ncbi:16S rRNA (adenine(1518)-N(6)/adenine(1519)-N(6))-dimethyltransferase [Candidatus Pantoea edessiphila]|uniref:Ribosomal RNA small subunit methyltransferase A n=1 Tax=Candidatus Pantoea edessiphila TaxID=2044610 RepID=A0A2P5T045_9GAMM|nr:16S rRNA (adenine(1518)-N(6)/adenine(1519)-N(6))-dimethyltransferase RsmA [Candidatus Pantoea edessiphila]PPI87964.1 16S rRNA (adenine(1518)-N(6)/adenine(1519)-N(6))-dimethyltransferase [Candidatus Pantoea edessiphila]
MNSFIYQGHYVRKRFGQHFLNDHDIINKITSAIHPKKDQLLIEIGPGLGALTKNICNYINELIVIELDQQLAKKLQENITFGSRLVVFQQNVLTFNFEKLASEKRKLLRLFGNLPYNISTTLIFNLFKYIHLIKDMHFTLQKEVVDRMACSPGSKTYGRLSVMMQYYCKIIPILEIHPRCFIPSPKVNSMLVRLIPYKHLLYSVRNIKSLNFITTIAFNQRRKTLNNSLNKVIPANIMKKLSIDPNLRAENISVAQYCNLANWLESN